MQLGMIGLGRMGSNMAIRLMRGGHQCVAHDNHAEPLRALVEKGAKGAATLADFIAAMTKPRIAWLMAPAAAVDPLLDQLAPLLERGDIVIDGGNSHFHDDIRRAAKLKELGVHYVDVGVSGGVWGLERGYCLMIGGDSKVVQHLDPIFRTLAPGINAAPRTPGAAGDASQAEYGYLHCGPNGAGHFVKMVHNGVEYGLMAAYSEGLNILKNANAGRIVTMSTQKPRRCEIPSFIDMSSTSPRSLRSGAAAASSAHGSWILQQRRCARIPTCRVSKDMWRIPAKGDGHCRRRSTRGFRFRFSARPCSSGSNRVVSATTPRDCCRRCDTNSEVTSRPRQRRELLE